MKKVYMAVVLAVLIAAVSVCSVGAYSLPKGMAVSNQEGANFESLVATKVYGYMGDADLNGKVNIRDATHIQKVVANLLEIEEAAQKVADADLSGGINVKDATAIQKWLVGFNVEAPVFHVLYSTNDEAQIESVAGSWVGKVNLANEINSKLYQAGDYPGFDFECVEIKVCLELNPDMTYRIYYDETSFEDTLAQFRADYAKGMQNFFEKYIADNKLDTTVAEILSTSGFESLEDFAEQAVDEKAVKSLIEFENAQGSYTVNGDTISVYDSEGEIKGVVDYDWFDVNLIITGGNHLIDADKCSVSFEKEK